jgi:hypothetical protein
VDNTLFAMSLLPPNVILGCKSNLVLFESTAHQPLGRPPLVFQADWNPPESISVHGNPQRALAIAVSQQSKPG